MNLFRSEEHARRWEAFRPESEEGFIALPDLAGLFGTESRRHMLDADYLSRWYPLRAAERRDYLARIGKASPFWLGTPAPDASAPRA
jgi:hypothetical protein